MSALDTQVGGDHYKNMAIQPVEYSTRNKLGFIAGCIVKYATRAPYKGYEREDIEKIIHFAQLWLEMLDEKTDPVPEPEQLIDRYPDPDNGPPLIFTEAQRAAWEKADCEECD